MKRHIALIVALLTLLCGILPAYAAGSLEIKEETWYKVSHSDDYRVYYYAVVNNGTNKPLSIKDLLFAINNASGETVDSTAKFKLYPEVLAAGEDGWLVISKDVKDLKSKSEIDHYTLTITTKVNDDKAANALSATAEYLKKDEDDNEDVLRASVTNSLSENACSVNIAMAARDASGKLLYIVGDATKDVGLASGSSLLYRSLMRSDILDELEDDGITVASVDAIAYTIEDLDD